MQHSSTEMEAQISPSADEIVQYQSLSTAAVLALVLGALSVVAFTSLPLLIVPMAAAALSIWALSDIGRSEGAKSGAGLAIWGLALAILFGVGSLVRIQVRAELLRRQADVAARDWLDLMSVGQFEEAFNQLSPNARRRMISEQANSATPNTPIEEFGSAQLEEDPLTSILRTKDKDRLTLNLRDSNIAVGPAEQSALLNYEANRAQAEPFSLTLLLSRKTSGVAGSSWLIDHWQSDLSTATATPSIP